MLAVGRALMPGPKLLLLDEPSLGLAPNFVEMIFDMIKEINKQGVTILLIEQNANMALSASDRAYVLENGVVTMEMQRRLRQIRRSKRHILDLDKQVCRTWKGCF